MKEYREMHRIFRREAQKLMTGIMEKAFDKCPYCGLKFTGTPRTNALGILRHIWDQHNEYFTPFFYKLMDNLIDLWEHLHKQIEDLNLQKAEFLGEIYAIRKLSVKSQRQVKQLQKLLEHTLREKEEALQIAETFGNDLHTRIENLEAKLRGTFKGKAKPLTLTSEEIMTPREVLDKITKKRRDQKNA
jgi:Mg2+ and Co2+ transporter CorA